MEVNLSSNESLSSSRNELPHGKSKIKQPESSSWGVRWQSTALMIFCYLLALTIAVTHLAFFEFLNGTQADGQGELVPQSYVNTISHILPSVFQIALQASLGAAFVHYLWFTLRRSALKVSTIETLFLIRSQPLLFFKLSALRDTWPLFFIASLIWAIYIVTIFPPGALTIGQALHRNHTDLIVPTFNSSFMGNGSVIDVLTYSLGSFIAGNENNTAIVMESSYSPDRTGPKLQSVARNVILNGEVTGTLSPCGANCSYTTTFDGPYFECNNSTSTSTFETAYDIITSSLPTIYDGAIAKEYIEQYATLNPKPVPMFTIISRSLIATSRQGYGNERQIISKQILTCTPFRARFAINNTYKNNVQVTKVSSTPLYPLPPLPPRIIFPVMDKTSSQPRLYNIGNWSSYDLKWYSDLNIRNLISAVAMFLTAEYIPTFYQNWTIEDTKIAGYGDVLWSLNNTWLDVGLDIASPFNPKNVNLHRALIADSKLNYYLNRPIPRLPVIPGDSIQISPSIEFTVTQELLNELLQNVTLSVIANYGYWNTTTNVTIDTLVNIYTFSSPKKLILPYFISLAIAFPFTILGIYALNNNGVPATDGGFMKMITTIGSAKLEREASVGCLGGEKDMPPRLKDMKIRFGELVDGREVQRGWDDEVVRRVGFGTIEEILPLEKGARYGKSSSVDIGVGRF